MNENNSILKQQKSIAVCIILSLITFGIYYIIWLSGVCKKIKLLNSEEPKAVGEVLLCIFIPFYCLYWFFSRSKKLASGATLHNIPLDNRAVINLLLAIFGFSIVSMALIQSDLNKVAEAISNGSAQI